MIGDSIRSASGKITPPYAASEIVGSGRRASAAETAGSSRPMNSQLVASGHHVENTERWPTSGAITGISVRSAAASGGGSIRSVGGTKGM